MEKGIQNADAIACKLRSASIRVTNYRLEVIRKKQRKRKEMIEKWKIKAIAAKCQRVKRRISLSSEKKKEL